MKDVLKRLGMVGILFLSLFLLVGCNNTVSEATFSELETSDDKKGETGDFPEEESQKEAEWYVEISGAVKHPGVYPVREGCRVFEVVALAGGFTKNACLDSINQAKAVCDEEQIYVCTLKEWERQQVQEEEREADAQESNAKVNVNEADVPTLMTLPGIGEAKAKAIVKYREEEGMFSCPEDIMKVQGIKKGVFQKIEQFIRVS